MSILLVLAGVAVYWALDPSDAQAEEAEQEEAKEEKAEAKKEADGEKSGDESKDEAEASFAADKGAAAIDVSGYPEKMQEYYKVFAKRCSKCHTLARPINSSYAGIEWKRYVKRMMRKPGSGINPKNGKKIVEFLMHDSEVRKKGVEESKEEE